MEKIEVGMGATVHGYTDSYACTIIKISKSGKTVFLQEDNAIIDKSICDFKPNIEPGGFVGHCTNQNDQVYKYLPDPHGRVFNARLNKKGQWKIIHNPSMRITFDVRAKFYDYNF